MKIAEVGAIQAGNWLFFRITTDSGISGIGEAGLWAYSAVCRQMVEYLRPYLVGKDPLAIEHHWQYVYRGAHFRGAAINGALAAVDLALWDIAGKYYGAPVYRLLGGPTRTKVRLYMHLQGETPDELAASARQAVVDGFTAVRFNAFGAATANLHYDALIQNAVEQVAAVRETVGRDVDLCVECHYRFTPAEAMDIGRALTQFRILFLEDPIPPEEPGTMGELAQRLPVAIGTGERLQTLEEFRALLAAGPVAYLRPDLCLTGITQAKKIAALAESWHVGIIPHNYLSPVSTAACVQLDAAIPNFVLQEYTGEDDPPKRNLVREPLRREGGYLVVPETPGLGVELDLDFIGSLAAESRPIFARTREDGSVIDG